MIGHSRLALATGALLVAASLPLMTPAPAVAVPACELDGTANTADCTVTIPAGVQKITAITIGGSGGDGYHYGPGGAGGKGAKVTSTHSVAGGEVVVGTVGYAGTTPDGSSTNAPGGVGYGTGGMGKSGGDGVGFSRGGGGGGSSAMTINGTVAVVAGGGGGGSRSLAGGDGGRSGGTNPCNAGGFVEACGKGGNFALDGQGGAGGVSPGGAPVYFDGSAGGAGYSGAGGDAGYANGSNIGFGGGGAGYGGGGGGTFPTSGVNWGSGGGAGSYSSGVDVTYATHSSAGNGSIAVYAQGLVWPEAVTTIPVLSSTSIVAASAYAVGSPAVTYSATGTSNCIVPASAPLTISATTIGSCDITASVAASGNFPAVAKTLSFTVVKVEQTVNWAPTNTSALTTASPLTPSVQATTNGDGAISYSTSSIGCSADATTGVITVTAAGTCSVTATAATTSTYMSASKTVDFVFTAPAPAPAPVACTVDVSGARSASGKLKVGKSYVLVKSAAASAGCELSVAAQVKPSAKRPFRVTTNAKTGRVEVKVARRAATLEVIFSAKPIAGTTGTDGTWKRSWKS